MTQTKNLKAYGFTLIEIITTIVIISVIAIISFTYANNYRLTQFNVKRTADMNVLESAAKSYFEVNKDYPAPAGNKQFFDENGIYAHSASKAFGVSGFATSKIFGKQFLAVTPMDPLTKNYYAYGKTLTGAAYYQFATALDKKGTYYAYVRGNYPAENLGGLIKEHNGPNFILNNSSGYLPYDPNEVKGGGSITSFSGIVKINGQQINDGSEVNESDVITVDSGSLAEIHLSDGSDIKLGSKDKRSVLEMKGLGYKEDDNIITKVIIKLSIGEIWVKAPELESGSELSVETDNAAATVRGTVFGVIYDDATKTGSISLIAGKIQMKNTGNSSYISMADAVFKTGTGSQYQKDSEGNYMMIVDEGQQPISVNFQNYGSATRLPSTNATGSVAPEKIQDVLEPLEPLNTSYMPHILKFSKDPLGNISFDISNRKANWLEIISNRYSTGMHIDSSSGVIQKQSIQGFSGVKTVGIRLCHIPDNYCTKQNGLDPVNAAPLDIDNDNSLPLPPLLIPTLSDNCVVRKPICSLWKNLEFSSGSLSFDESKTGSLTNTGSCNQINTANGTSICEKFIVAYAPLESSNLFQMFTTGAVIKPTKIKSFQCESGFTLANSGSLSTIYESGPITNLFVLGYANGFTWDNNRMTYRNDYSLPSNSSVVTIKSYLEPNYSCEKYIGSQVSTVGTKFSGSGAADYYIPSLAGSGFAIETTVRGSTLMRSSSGSNFYIFNLGSSINNTFLVLHEGALFLGNSLYYVRKIDQTILSKLNYDTIYRIRSSYNGSNLDLQLLNNDGTILSQSNNVGNLTNSLNLNPLRIGNNALGNSVWGDYIKDLKIYKLPVN